MKSYDQCDCEDICDPISTVDQLLRGGRDSFKWCDMVEPLVERSAPRFLHNKFYSMDYGSAAFEAENNRPEVLVCHDYKGNYLDDKFINGTPKWEEYRFYNWNCIDAFCYFSHNLVTVPTLQFLNAAHKNGVKVLGTLIVEGTDGQKALCEDILSSTEQSELVANCLVDLCKKLKFEGWLLNVEVSVDKEKIPMLKHFVQYLTHKTRREVVAGKIIWYDSVTHEGNLAWQNELNGKNETFFNRSDGIFTNYNWSIQHLERTSKLVDTKFPSRRNDVYFGIDVFGRGQIAGFRSSEVSRNEGSSCFTFKHDIEIYFIAAHPQTLSKISAFKFSSAIFAPAWTCETIDVSIGFEGLENGSEEYRDRFNQRFLERNDRFWSSMYEYFYMFGPKNLPMVTNFCIGSGKKFYRMGREVKKNWFNLKLQGIQPSTPAREGFYSHNYDDAFDGGSSVSLDTSDLIRLFVCELPCDDDIVFSYTFKRHTHANDLQANLTVLDVSKSIDIQLVCDGNGTNPFAISSLAEDDVRNIAIFFSSNGQTFIPSNINGWETRYYLLKFERSARALITDIGFKKMRRGRVFLGHIAFYSANHLGRDFEHINAVQL